MVVGKNQKYLSTVLLKSTLTYVLMKNGPKYIKSSLSILLHPISLLKLKSKLCCIRSHMSLFVRKPVFGFRKKRYCTICVAKTKALISFAVTAKLICGFVFVYAKKNGFLMTRLISLGLIGTVMTSSSLDF